MNLHGSAVSATDLWHVQICTRTAGHGRDTGRPDRKVKRQQLFAVAKGQAKTSTVVLRS